MDIFTTLEKKGYIVKSVKQIHMLYQVDFANMSTRRAKALACLNYKGKVNKSQTPNSVIENKKEPFRALPRATG